MKIVASILLILFSFLTVQTSLAIPQVHKAEKKSCCMSCCNNHKEKKAPKTPAKGMCGDFSCNPFAEYACCNGFIVANKTIFTFILEKVAEKNILHPKSYTYDFVCDCWQPPENTVTTLG